jgi:hypothetical protein
MAATEIVINIEAERRTISLMLDFVKIIYWTIQTLCDNRSVTMLQFAIKFQYNLLIYKFLPSSR